MIWLVVHHFLALNGEVWSGLQVVGRYGLLPSLVICLKFVKEMSLVFLLPLSSHKQHSEP